MAQFHSRNKRVLRDKVGILSKYTPRQSNHATNPESLMPNIRHVEPRHGDIVLLVGTMKGAFLFRSDGSRGTWEMGGPYFPGNAVYAMAYDRVGALKGEKRESGIIQGEGGFAVHLKAEVGHRGPAARESSRGPRGAPVR